MSETLIVNDIPDQVVEKIQVENEAPKLDSDFIKTTKKALEVERVNYEELNNAKIKEIHYSRYLDDVRKNPTRIWDQELQKISVMLLNSKDPGLQNPNYSYKGLHDQILGLETASQIKHTLNQVETLGTDHFSNVNLKKLKNLSTFEHELSGTQVKESQGLMDYFNEAIEERGQVQLFQGALAKKVDRESLNPDQKTLYDAEQRLEEQSKIRRAPLANYGR